MKKFTRRDFTRLAAASGVAAVALPGARAFANEPAKPDQIVVNASGGSMEEAMKTAFTSAYEERFGVRVLHTSPVDVGKLKAMVESGNVEWDVTELGAQEAVLAEREGLLEKMDFSIIDLSDFPEQAKKSEYWFSRSTYATVMGYSTEAFPDKHPTTWAEFWDVETFPGPRTLRDHPVDNLEYALLADGVAPEDLYPLDVDRAFAKLDEIAPHIAAWWSSGQQPAQMLLDGEAVLASGWNGRFFTLIKDGAPVDIEWGQGAAKLSAFAIPKGAKNAYWGQKYLAVMTEPELQAIYANMIGYPGLNINAFNYVDAELQPYLPTHPDNLGKMFWTDDIWWADNQQAMVERWSAWKLAQQ